MTWAKKPAKQKKAAKRDLELQWPILSRCGNSWASEYIFSTHASYSQNKDEERTDTVPHVVQAQQPQGGSSSLAAKNKTGSTTSAGVPKLSTEPPPKPVASTNKRKKPSSNASQTGQSRPVGRPRKKPASPAASAAGASSATASSETLVAPELSPVLQATQLVTPGATPKKRLGTPRGRALQQSPPIDEAAVRSQSLSPRQTNPFADFRWPTNPHLNWHLQSPNCQKARDPFAAETCRRQAISSTSKSTVQGSCRAGRPEPAVMRRAKYECKAIARKYI